MSDTRLRLRDDAVQEVWDACTSIQFASPETVRLHVARLWSAMISGLETVEDGTPVVEVLRKHIKAVEHLAHAVPASMTAGSIMDKSDAGDGLAVLRELLPKGDG